MAAIYLPGMVTIIPMYQVGRPSMAANVTHWFTSVTSLTTGMLTAIQTAFNGSWGTHVINLMASTDTYAGCWVIDSSSATGGQVTNAAFLPTLGTAGSQPLGDQVCCLLSLHGATRYRGGHSRVYLPSPDMSKTNVDGSTLNASGISIVNGIWNTTVAAMAGLSPANGGPLAPTIWHKKWAAHPNTQEPVISATAQDLLATQRRRLRKVSRHRAHIA